MPSTSSRWPGWEARSCRAATGWASTTVRVSDVTTGMTSTVSAPAMMSVPAVASVMNPPVVAMLQTATMSGRAIVL